MRSCCWCVDSDAWTFAAARGEDGQTQLHRFQIVRRGVGVLSFCEGRQVEAGRSRQFFCLGMTRVSTLVITYSPSGLNIPVQSATASPKLDSLAFRGPYLSRIRICLQQLQMSERVPMSKRSPQLRMSKRFIVCCEGAKGTPAICRVSLALLATRESAMCVFSPGRQKVNRFTCEGGNKGIPV